MKRIIILLLMIASVVSVNAQITDTAFLRNYINTNIVPNSTQSITATKLNAILNGQLNVMQRYKPDTVYARNDSIFQKKYGVESFVVKLQNIIAGYGWNNTSGLGSVDTALIQKRINAGTDISISGNTIYNTSTLNSVMARDSVTTFPIKITTNQSGSYTTPGLYVSAPVPIETHSPFAQAGFFYVHADQDFRAPYLVLRKSRGTQSAQTTVRPGSYETSSIGGITFQGYDGSSYAADAGPAILSQVDETWTTTKHGSHLSIYYNRVGQPDADQAFQFGGPDAAGQNDTTNRGVVNHNISLLALSFLGNRTGNPMLLPTSVGLPSDTASITIASGDEIYAADSKANSFWFIKGTLASPTGTGKLKWDNVTGAKTIQLPNATGTVALTSDIPAAGVTTMASIGSSPNTNGASISGSTLTLQPASSSFGGVVTTSTQTFAGVKTFNSGINATGGAGGSFIMQGHTASAGYGALYSGAVTPGSTNYALVSNGASTAINGTTAVTVQVNGTAIGTFNSTNTTFSQSVILRAGTSTASTAPIKFTSGTNLSTPENGAVEYDGTDYYLTSGGTRYKLSRTLTGSVTWDIPSLATGSSDFTTVTVTGAAVGDHVVIGFPSTVTVQLNYIAYVSAANTVTIYVTNNNSGTFDPASLTYTVRVIKQ